MKAKLLERLIELALDESGKDVCPESPSAPSSLSSYAVGKYCVIRTYSAGVHLGTVKAREGREMLLTNARRLHYWEGAFTLSAVANQGVGSKSRLSEPVEEILLTEVIEVLPCSQNAEKQFKEMASHEID